MLWEIKLAIYNLSLFTSNQFSIESSKDPSNSASDFSPAISSIIPFSFWSFYHLSALSSKALAFSELAISESQIWDSLSTGLLKWKNSSSDSTAWKRGPKIPPPSESGSTLFPPNRNFLFLPVNFFGSVTTYVIGSLISSVIPCCLTSYFNSSLSESAFLLIARGFGVWQEFFSHDFISNFYCLFVMKCLILSKFC